MSKRRRRYMQEFPKLDKKERELHLVLAIRWLAALIGGGGSATVVSGRPKTLE
jgi:hypothetical protein